MKPSMLAIYASVILGIGYAAVAQSCATVPTLKQAVSPKVLDCQYHVLDTYLGGDQELVQQVLQFGQGQVIEEFVAVLVNLDRSDAQIVDAGAALIACYPQKVVAPIPDAGNKVL